MSSHVDDFNTRNKVLTAKLPRQGYRYRKLRKAFSKLYRRHFDLESSSLIKERYRKLKSKMTAVTDRSENKIFCTSHKVSNLKDYFFVHLVVHHFENGIDLIITDRYLALSFVFFRSRLFRYVPYLLSTFRSDLIFYLIT